MTGALVFSSAPVHAGTTGAIKTVKVTFNANGGKIAFRGEPVASTKVCYVDQNSTFEDASGRIQELMDGEVVFLANAEFDGWWTAKTGGRKWRWYDEVSQPLTLYARWRKLYTLKSSLSGYGIGGSYLEGEWVKIPAPWRAVSGGKVFAGWQVSPAKVTIDYATDSEEAGFVMPAANVTLTPTWIDSPGYLTVDVYGGNNVCSISDGLLEWSADGKVWFPADGEPYPVKPGKVTVQYRYEGYYKNIFTSVPAKETFMIRSGEEFWTYVTLRGWATVETFCDSWEGSVTPSLERGTIDKTFTLTAKPAKDYFFVGWKSYWVEEGEKILSYANPLKFIPEKDGGKYLGEYADYPNNCYEFEAVFRYRWDMEWPEIYGLNDSLEDCNCGPSTGNSATLKMVGVAYEGRIEVNEGARPLKFSASGLPAGLKIDAATGVISGVPTKAGFYNPVITATSVANPSWKTSRAFPMEIETLPLWAQGTFSGSGQLSCSPESVAGSMTVSSAGKISLKLGTKSFSVPSFSRESTRTSLMFENQKGSDRLSGSIDPYNADNPDEYLGIATVSRMTCTSDGLCANCSDAYSLYRNIWNDKNSPANVILNNCLGYYTMSLSHGQDWGFGYLTLTVAAKGAVKVTGKMWDGTAVSVSATLCLNSSSASAKPFFTLALAPAAYKSEAYSMPGGGKYYDVGSISCRIVFEGNGRLRIEDGRLENYNPKATRYYGEIISTEFGGRGTLYNKTAPVDSYYRNLRLKELGHPGLDYLFKESYYYDRYVTYQYYDHASATLCDSLWNVTITLDPNGKVSVPKATTPAVVDKAHNEYSYAGANDAALSFSFAKATGIFKGTFLGWYDYESAYDERSDRWTYTHTSVKYSYEGVWVQPRGDVPSSFEGFFLAKRVGVTEDANGRTKTYNCNDSHRVSFGPVQR